MKSKNHEIIDVFNSRYACKKFDKNRKVSDEDFNTIIESARLSPSSFGLEPWKFLLLKNEKIKEDFREFAWGAINSLNGASHIVIVLARKGVTADSKHVAHMLEDVKRVPEEMKTAIKERFGRFQEKHFKLLESERSLFDWASKQTYIVLGNMMTTAAFLGIDSCAIEGFERESAEKYLSDKGILDLNEYGISYMVSFGYRDEEQPIKTRQNLSEVFEIIE